jgi:hypothetical protein
MADYSDFYEESGGGHTGTIVSISNKQFTVGLKYPVSVPF